MNLLYLANVVVAEVGEDYYWHWTHDQEIGKALIAACATVIAAFIAIIGVFKTARKTTQQMELSKQGTPPELTRYKEWLEASEKYKEIMEFEENNDFKDPKEEYGEIRESRIDALGRAVWERKVFAACPDVHARKRILQIPPSVISEYDKNESGEKEIYYVNPRNILSFAMMTIFLIVIWTLYGFLIYSGSHNLLQAILLALVIALFVTSITYPLFYWASSNLYSGSLKVNYYLRQMVYSSCVKNNNSENSENGNIFINVDQEKIIMMENLRYAVMDSEWEAFVNCPWDLDGHWKTLWKKVKCMYYPSRYVNKDIEEFRKINTGDEKDAYVLSGSYKDKILNGDLKQKIELCREDSRCQKEVASEGEAVGVGSDNKN